MFPHMVGIFVSSAGLHKPTEDFDFVAVGGVADGQIQEIAFLGNAFGVAEETEALLAVVATHATVTHPAKGQAGVG